jgi:hypothetical protein
MRQETHNVRACIQAQYIREIFDYFLDNEEEYWICQVQSDLTKSNYKGS